jgi:acyl carrier protein phosphodiesterase
MGSGINFLLMAKQNWLASLLSKTKYLYQCMNYLAHAYLSFENPGILTGNMISDYIKGKKQFDYPLPVQKGIKLHRAIDDFTDTHAATQELKSFFRPQYRLYSGAFADVVYDHFLANDTDQFNSETDLKIFAENTYQLLEAHKEFFPLPFQKMFPYMKEYDWLYNYRHTWGIEKSFGGVVRRSAYLTESDIAFEIFNTHYEAMQVCYNVFFPDLKKYSLSKLDELLNS